MVKETATTLFPRISYALARIFRLYKETFVLSTLFASVDLGANCTEQSTKTVQTILKRFPNVCCSYLKNISYECLDTKWKDSFPSKVQSDAQQSFHGQLMQERQRSEQCKTTRRRRARDRCLCINKCTKRRENYRY